jgi:Domain of unknown function (DUF4136)
VALRRSRLSARLILSRRSTPFTAGGSAGAGVTGVGSVERTPVGTLHIDMFDSQSKKVIWHGVCTDTLTGSPEKNEKKMEKSVADVFKKFPPPEKG